MTDRTGRRLDYLDAVRSFALLLGIIFHASLSFMPIFIGWAVMDINTSEVVSIFVLISHSFRMPLFFLIAGFFTCMSLSRKPAQDFVQSRLIRIAIPFCVLWFVLRPLLVSGWILGAQSMQGDVDILASLQQGFATLGNLPSGLWVGTHLWFLYYLLLITFSVLVVRYAVTRWTWLHNALITVGDKAVMALCGLVSTGDKHTLSTVKTALARLRSGTKPVLSWAIVILFTVASLWFMQSWGVDTPDKSLVPNIPVFILYGGCFLVGFALFRIPQAIEAFGQLNTVRLVVCVAAVIGAIVLSPYEMQKGHAYYIWLKLGYTVSYAIMMWMLIGLTIGGCKKLFSNPSSVVRYIADASYWLYLIHLPIVVWLQIAFAELPLHWAIKWISVSGLTVIIGLISYHCLVRHSLIGFILNGKKVPKGTKGEQVIPTALSAKD
ncbi:acyltransferase family protein [Alteromonas sp. D210916BOD_24]|uniref:acyltransferase family protein n=1 Tax=Alteromonas sp. D210916BOD_24 TaxID=3157618 RepID=UPI00399D15D9